MVVTRLCAIYSFTFARVKFKMKNASFLGCIIVKNITGFVTQHVSKARTLYICSYACYCGMCSSELNTKIKGLSIFLSIENA